MPKYNSISTIPAKVFFTILETKNYQLLKLSYIELFLNKIFRLFNKSYVNLEKVFVSIYDEFFLKSDNKEAKRYLELTKEISFIEYKIASIKQSLHFYFYNRTTEEMRNEFIEALKKGFGIEINKDVPFIEEVKRVLDIEIGILNNDLEICKIEFNEMLQKSKGKIFDYEEQIVNFESAIKRSINDDIKLDKYIAYEKQAYKTIQLENKRNNGK